MFSIITSLVLITIIVLFLNEKYQKSIFSSILFALSFGYFAYFIQKYIDASSFYQQITWLKTISLNIDFNNKMLYFLLPPFVATLGISILNIIDIPKKALKQNAVMVLNCVSLVLASSATNSIQLFSCIAFISITSLYYFTDDIANKKKFIYYNFIADFSMMFVFIGYLATLDTIDLNKISTASKEPFLNILFSIAIAIKLGLWGVNNYLISLKSSQNNKGLSIVYTSTPIQGLIVASKVPELVHPYICYWALGSAFLYLWFFIKDKNLKTKIISFALSSASMSFYFNTPYIFFASLLIAFIIYLIISAASLETDISLMGHFIKKAKILYIITLATIFAYAISVINLEKGVILKAYLGFGLLGFALLLRLIFIKNFSGLDKVYDNIKNPSIIKFLPILFVFLFINYNISLKAVLFFIAFLGLQFVKFDSIIKQSEQRDIKLLHIIENLISYPLRLLGRLLWLVVDFLLIKKTILHSSTTINACIAEKYTYLEDKNKFWTMLGVIILIIIVGVKYL